MKSLLQILILLLFFSIDSGSTATDNFIIIGMGQKSTEGQDNQTTLKAGEEKLNKIANQQNSSESNKNKSLWFKDKQKPILADIFKKPPLQDVYF